MPTAKRVSKTSSGSKRIQADLLNAAEELRDSVDSLVFDEPVTHVYNPLQYAWGLHEQYVGQVGPKVRVLFLGMNPGPWGMAQTGVPFGEIDAVANWMGIQGEVDSPSSEHPKRPIEGLACERSEVSGRRLWGLMSERYPKANDFFKEHFIANYCPLVFMEESGKNRTPDKLPASEKKALEAVCDAHLVRVLQAAPWTDLIGVGAFAEKCLIRCVQSMGESDVQKTSRKKAVRRQTEESAFRIHRILHPSPASPAANKDWAGKATQQLQECGLW
ncbi:single-stranded DNA-binding protein [Rhodopirellula sp. JC740]|uniref:Single-stranded DNA-binding protein n=1 Tax=Rhodopirellula halodulae TaxID=2894198 RepID=A0ABS8NFL8_9BACT|nr:uracil-DNA glycosylase family protein [Rhodopirellula sp. JC740]MCC9642350.1 single-stranded DNA-binding protein [Rhodopirellula sp. JC740]